MEFRYRLMNLRRENNLKAEELAKMVGVSPSAVSLWERGKNYPNQNILIKICDIFNCSVDYILGRTDERYMFTKLDKQHDFFIPNFDKLSDEEKELITNVARTLAEKYLSDKD